MPHLFIDLDDFVPGGAGGLDPGDVVPRFDREKAFAPGGCYHEDRAPELEAMIRRAIAEKDDYAVRLSVPPPHGRTLDDVIYWFAGVGPATRLAQRLRELLADLS